MYIDEPKSKIFRSVWRTTFQNAHDGDSELIRDENSPEKDVSTRLDVKEEALLNIKDA